MTFTDAELDALTADLRHSTLDIETGEKLDPGAWASVAIEEVDQAIAAITYLRAKLAERDALGAVVMRERVAKACETIEETLRQGYAVTSANAVGEAYCAIRALPLPTHAELLAAARELPEIKALESLLNSFSMTCASGSFYSDCYLHFRQPYSMSLRLSNDSTKSFIVADFESRRVSALAALEMK